MTRTETREVYLTVREAAAMFKLNPKTIYRAVATRDLNHHRFGRSIRITLSDLQQWANRNRH